MLWLAETENCWQEWLVLVYTNFHCVTWPLQHDYNHYSAPPRPNLHYFLVGGVWELVVAMDQALDLYTIEWRHMLVDSGQCTIGISAANIDPYQFGR